MISVPSGLKYINNIMDDSMRDSLLEFVDEQLKTNRLELIGRQVLQYRYRYDYRTRLVRKIVEDDKFPKILSDLLCSVSIDDFNPNQCLINIYNPGEYISKHIDSPVFDNTIACFTLGASANMLFTKGSDKYTIKVEDKSLYIMSGDARWKWTHEMLPCDERRISITFRTVKKLA